MKKLILMLALVSPIVWADNCRIHQASQLMDERNVSALQNLVKNKNQNSCNVKFDVVIDGQEHSVNWTHETSGDPEIACQTAIQNGMKELHLRLGGKFQTEAITVCKEGQPKQFQPIKKGYTGLETEFPMFPEQTKYFKHNNNKCRFFRERYDGKVFKGVICQNDDELWTVVAKY